MKFKKEINVLASLASTGGGEQSVLMISYILMSMGWKVNIIPWGNVAQPFKNNIFLQDFTFQNGMESKMRKGIPLFFYGNGQVYDFAKEEKVGKIVKQSSHVILGINYLIGGLNRTKWLADTKKVTGIIFLNSEKKDAWKKNYRQTYDYDINLSVLAPCIELQNFRLASLLKRQPEEKLVILKHCRTDTNKFVLECNQSKGDNYHIWQKHIPQELDIDFYEKILEEVPNVHFKFMAAPQELTRHFQNNSCFTFYNWNEMDVSDFLSSGHLFLYRVAKICTDQGPRVICEAMASGLTCISEPRDGPRDRIVHGDNGFYAIETSDYISKIKLLMDNEELRLAMGVNARRHAQKNFKPEAWGDKINKLLENKI